MSFRVLIDAPKPCSGCCIDRIANLYNQTILILLVALECDNLRHVAGSAACGRCDKRTSVSPSSGGNCAGWVVHVAARQVTPCRPCRGLPLAFGHRPSGDRFAGGQQPFEHSPCGLRPSLTLGPSFRRGQNAVARPRWGGRPGLRPPTSFGRALRFASASHGQTRRLPPVTGQRYLSWIVGRTKDSLEKGFLWCWLFWFREFIECQQCHLLLRDCFFLRFNQLFLGY